MLCTTAGAGGVVGLGLGDGDALALADALAAGLGLAMGVAPTALALGEAVGAAVDERELGRPSVPGGAESEQAAETSRANASVAARITAARDRMRAPRGT
jgi:hypothetical protein